MGMGEELGGLPGPGYNGVGRRGGLSKLLPPIDDRHPLGHQTPHEPLALVRAISPIHPREVVVGCPTPTLPYKKKELFQLIINLNTAYNNLVQIACIRRTQDRIKQELRNKTMENDKMKIPLKS